MSTEERNTFEDLAREDEEFRKEAMNNLRAIQQIGREEIRQQITDDYGEAEREWKRKRWKRIRPIGLAASVLLLVGVGLVLMFSRELSLKGIFEDNYAFLKVSSRGGAEDLDSLWNVALDCYERPADRDYPKAIRLFNELLADTTFPVALHNQAHLYLGGAYLEMEWPRAAIDEFSKVSPYATAYIGDAVWYRALAWLQLGEQDSACHEFSAIAYDLRWSWTQRKEAVRVYDRIGCGGE